MSLVPPLQSSGIFKLSAPYASDLLNQVSYTCVAIRQFKDIQKLGVDPYTAYYVGKGIAIETYNQHVAAGESIVSLQSNAGHWVYVPTAYIESYPNMGGIPYTAIALGITLGAIPNYLDLAALKLRIKEIVFETTGLQSDVKSIALSATKNILQADHNAIEAARLQNVTANQTDRARLLAANSQIASLQQRIQTLEQYISANIPP